MDGYQHRHEQVLSAPIDRVADRYDLSREEACAIAGVTADVRISEVVDVPHPLASAAIRLDIFDS